MHLTDGDTEFSSVDRICIPCSVVGTAEEIHRFISDGHLNSHYIDIMELYHFSSLTEQNAMDKLWNTDAVLGD